jgi:hypothetical protein
MPAPLRCLLVLLLGLVAAAPSRAATPAAAPAGDALVLVGGATGRTGRLIAQALLDNGFAVRGRCRGHTRPHQRGEDRDGYVRRACAAHGATVFGSMAIVPAAIR